MWINHGTNSFNPSLPLKYRQRMQNSTRKLSSFTEKKINRRWMKTMNSIPPGEKISTSILSSNTNAALTLFALDENIIFDGIRFNAAHNSLRSMCGIYQGARSSLFPAAALLIFWSCQKFVLNLSFLEREECQFPFTSQATVLEFSLSFSSPNVFCCQPHIERVRCRCERKRANGGPCANKIIYLAARSVLVVADK